MACCGTDITSIRYGSVLAQEYFDYYAGWARIYEAGEIISSDDPNEPSLPQDPARRLGGHPSWNFPVFVMARNSRRRSTGNTVVVKSSEVTPLTCARIAELWTRPTTWRCRQRAPTPSTVGASAKSVGSRRA